MSTKGKKHIQLALKKENAHDEDFSTEVVMSGEGYIVIPDEQGGFSIQQAKKNCWGNLILFLHLNTGHYIFYCHT